MDRNERMSQISNRIQKKEMTNASK